MRSTKSRYKKSQRHSDISSKPSLLIHEKENTLGANDNVGEIQEGDIDGTASNSMNTSDEFVFVQSRRINAGRHNIRSTQEAENQTQRQGNSTKHIKNNRSVVIGRATLGQDGFGE
ncbi:hypothetical protein HHI36_014822 [Cryptolaemus montrouzieri]|uniref:Uncharacterized protein n=1 Tax=Cryptolaemus montrouzieri TaxID=559131 RepID=A0ABD2N489_9CUCU